MGLLGQWAILVSLISTVLASFGYGYHHLSKKPLFKAISHGAYFIHLSGVLLASGILVYLLIQHEFGYYYVYNHTSTNLELRYLISAFWGGQEGSFLLWIVLSGAMGLGLMKWVSEPYKTPVLMFLSINQIFLLLMIVGLKFGDITIGASPFKSIAEAFPNAPFLQSNPNYIPTEGKGLNDLLKSPWMVIHPPALFLGFSMMGIPCYFAMAALLNKDYHGWVKHTMPWAVAANLSLFIAIFLGGYWAYITLSFGGYWAWDPVENASILPWLVGIAAIHFKLMHRKSATSLKAALIFSILAYAAVVYESFLTRSGILGDASVHSFTDLGLYNQLLLFLLAVLLGGGTLLALRWKELPKKEPNLSLLEANTWIMAGGYSLFTLSVIIGLGTSSPIIGRLFKENPTPPEISFYNEWSLPLACIIALLTVFGQYFYWKKLNVQELGQHLQWPVISAALITLISLFIAEIKQMSYIILVFTSWFGLIGNAQVLYHLSKTNKTVLGGTLSHIGFAVMLLGVLASSAFDRPLLDAKTINYNQAISEGKVLDSEGFPLQNHIEYIELKRDEPKIINGKYQISYEGFDYTDQSRQGQHAYTIRISRFNPKKADSNVQSKYLYPEVYPMSTGSSINWSVDVDVLAGLFSDVYLYVAGSSYVEQQNRKFEQKNNPHNTVPANTNQGEWVLLIAKEKPFVSLVWAGIFIIMIGSSLSIFRHRSRMKSHQ